jgi:transcriptional repressor of cell division inhibition gene dicB
MLKKDVISHYGSQSAVARALGISHAAVQKWPDVVPEGSAWKLQGISDGALVVDQSKYQKTVDRTAA